MRIALFITIAILLVIGSATTTYIIGANQSPLPENAIADRIIIEKHSRRLVLLHGTDTLKVYRVALGRHPDGPKEREGDSRTPEGTYIIDFHKPNSGFHRALHVSYPNPSDIARAQQLGVSPGGDIMIHGLKNGLGWLGPTHRLFDWTRGCIALTDAEIEEIYRAVPNSTPIEIRP